MTKSRAALSGVIVSAAAAAVLSQTPAGEGGDLDWGVYRGDQKGSQYAPLAQIHAANVHRLQPVWEYRTGDATERSTMHVNPVVVNAGCTSRRPA